MGIWEYPNTFFSSVKETISDCFVVGDFHRVSLETNVTMTLSEGKSLYQIYWHTMEYT